MLSKQQYNDTLDHNYKILCGNLWFLKNIPNQSNRALDYLKGQATSLDTKPIATLATKPTPTVATKPTPAPDALTTQSRDSWEELTKCVNVCTQCKLHQNRHNVVLERGNRQAKWMFVGEAPGENEDLQGKPFVGLAGELLNKMILAMKLDVNQDVYICNVVKCRPPFNRNPDDDEILACNKFLVSQINLVKPKIIIALGRFASKALLNTNQSVGKLRGFKTHKAFDIPVVVTYHPAYLLRNPSAKVDAWNDLKLALKLYES